MTSVEQSGLNGRASTTSPQRGVSDGLRRMMSGVPLAGPGADNQKPPLGGAWPARWAGEPQEVAVNHDQKKRASGSRRPVRGVELCLSAPLHTLIIYSVICLVKSAFDRSLLALYLPVTVIQRREM